jgi:energy-coupling factor transporter ATP-binding protein EcfA2
MREAQLLVLDKPTSALDARSEHRVFEQFGKLTQGKMTLLISDRSSTVRMADQIFVLDEGSRNAWGIARSQLSVCRAFPLAGFRLLLNHLVLILGQLCRDHDDKAFARLSLCITVLGQGQIDEIRLGWRFRFFFAKINEGRWP